MNVAQIRIDVRDKLSAGFGQNTNISSDLFWADLEITSYINQAYRKVTNAIRRARAEYFVRTLRSDDSTFAIMGINYNPSSFKMIQDTGSYTLPPDFIRLIGLYDARDDDRIRFIGSSIVKETMKSSYQLSDNNNVEAGAIAYDIIGKNTLIIRPKPREDFDTILVYERILEPLTEYIVGTISVTNNSITASLTGADLTNKFNVGDEIIVGSPSATPTIYTEEVYSTIKSIDIGGSMITFESPYVFTTQTDAKYIRAKVPDVSYNHVDAISYYSVYRGFAKGTNPNIESSQLYLQDFNDSLKDVISDVEVRHYQDMEFADAYLEDVYE